MAYDQENQYIGPKVEHKKIVTTQVLSCGKNGPEFPLTKMVILSKKSMIENMPLESNGLCDLWGGINQNLYGGVLA